MIVKSHLRDYSVEFVETDGFLRGIVTQPNHLFIIDENVWGLHRELALHSIPEDIAVIQPVHEDVKNLDTVAGLYDRLVTLEAKKNITLVVIGGGILQDICGYAASTLYRGIRWMFVPTTLLAQVDSCIGSKTSINYKGYKNLIGTFYPPSAVFIYPQFLLTLSALDYYSGLGEIVKLHIMAGPQKIEEIKNRLPLLKQKDPSTLRSVIEDCLVIKKGYIEEDEFDSGRRNLLNYGHCFGHAIETISNFAIPHGQAVVIGMILANAVACRRGLLRHETNDYIYEALLKQSLLIDGEKMKFNPDLLIAAMKQDKKRTGEHLALIMTDDTFNFVRVSDVTEEEVEEALSALHRTTRC